MRKGAVILLLLSFFQPLLKESLIFSQNLKLVPRVHVREADVAWSREIWRVIDMREKINLPLYYPVNEMTTRNSLFSTICRGIASGELTAYDPMPSVFAAGEEFSRKLSAAEAQKSLTRDVVILKEDTVTGEMYQESSNERISPGEVLQYRIREEWFFDKARSVMEVRILGIAPVVETTDDAGAFRGYKVLFWLYFPECRNFFSQYRCYNPYNDAEYRTFDEVFQKRLFASYVSMESNVYNRPIAAFANGMDALLESDAIKDELFRFEQGLWHY